MRANRDSRAIFGGRALFDAVRPRFGYFVRVDARLAKLRDPGWTPGRRDVRPLLELLGTVADEDAEAIVRLLADLVEAATVIAAIAPAPEKTAHRFVTLLGRVAPRDAKAVAPLMTSLTTGDPRSRKAAARALGKLPKNVQDTRVESALVDALGREERPEVRRALLEALGRSGGARAREAIDRATREAPPTDALTERFAARAKVKVERTLERGATDADRIVAPAEADRIVLRCREGLEELLRSELGARAFVAQAGEVRVSIRRGASELEASRLWTSVTVPLETVPTSDDVAEDIVRGLRAARDRLMPWTNGLFRFRLEFRDRGHRRAVAFRVAELLAGDPSFRNDPTASPWTLEVDERDGRLAMVAIAKKLDDRRFAYRVADVPAASHPTIAAALALVSSVEPKDVVWDPFVGSGLELVERARLGPARLVGTDLDDRALAAARANASAAGITIELTNADARTFAAPEPTLILTNPPVGRRVTSDTSLDELLAAFLEHAVDVLASGGRLVWLTPRARSTDRVLAARGMKLTQKHLVDMGGFSAELQRWDKPKRRRVVPKR